MKNITFCLERIKFWIRVEHFIDQKVASELKTSYRVGQIGTMFRENWLLDRTYKSYYIALS